MGKKKQGIMPELKYLILDDYGNVVMAFLYFEDKEFMLKILQKKLLILPSQAERDENNANPN